MYTSIPSKTPPLSTPPPLVKRARGEFVPGTMHGNSEEFRRAKRAEKNVQFFTPYFTKK